jgi:hypothetical protein
MPSSVLTEDANVTWACMYIIAAYDALTHCCTTGDGSQGLQDGVRMLEVPLKLILLRYRSDHVMPGSGHALGLLT